MQHKQHNPPLKGSYAVARVALRTTHGGHAVPEEDVRRRFTRSRRHFLEDYLPLADESALWDNASPPPVPEADHSNCGRAELEAMLNSPKVQEPSPSEMPEIVRLGLEAGRAATAKMLDFYKRMGIRVTPQMTLAPEPKKREPSKRSRPPGVTEGRR